MIDILIVEDEIHISKMIEATLSIGGYRGHICGNGKEAVQRVLEEKFDLILLDVMLPDMNGFQVIEEIRCREVPVIFLTAMQEVSDKVKGLKLGAEDYIVKPFEAVELLARIEVVLRRTHRNNNILNYKYITIDIDKHIVKKSGEIINLTPKEFEILVFFIQHVDIAITRERLLAAVWGYEFIGESRTIDIHVQHVRKKMDLNDKLITIPKLGYRLES
ncbi:response regulator transcription factor [uncultured Clostridium sp.]|uniref:response regulator transcription factor n=1 Tax=uncultured Clostridium sp. TaxID=59620 RepID=UPI003217D485